MKPVLSAVFSAYLFLVSTSLFAQQTSTFETEVFRKIKNDSINTFDLLHALDYDEEMYQKSKTQITNHIKSLNNLHNKPLKKRIQTIYKTTHNKFFEQYKAEAYFKDIFSSGTYNCVTATALYALLFEEFNVNYSIKETSTHVYIIADTMGLQTLVESTLPGVGVIKYNDKFKKDFVDYLVSNKIIPESDLERYSISYLFRKNFTSDKSISLNQLAALQYYNKGVFLMLDDKHMEAAPYFQKAASVYPSNQINFSYSITLQNALFEDYENKTYDGALYGQLLEVNNIDSTLIEAISGTFKNISIDLCIKTPQIEKYNAFYKALADNCKEENIPTEIQFNYNFYNAYYHHVNSNYNVAYEFAKKSYKINPGHLYSKDIISELASNKLRRVHDHKSQIDTIDVYFSEFPFLKKHDYYSSSYVTLYMRVISDAVNYDRVLEAERYYAIFLSKMAEHKFDYYDHDHITQGFSILAAEYTKEGKFNKSLQILDKGIELAPYSAELKDIREAVYESMNIHRNYERKYTRNDDDKPIVKTDSEVLRDKIESFFPGNWEAVSILMEDTKQSLNENEKFEFVADKAHNCTYIQKGKSETGKWSYRMKSKCIYFVPDHDKDQYKVFRIKEITEDRIILRPYKDQRTPSPYKYVLHRKK